MARRKKSGAGGGIGAVVVGLLVLLVAIPREVWIGVGVLAAVGVGIYLYLKSKGSAQAAPQEAARPAPAVTRLESRAPVVPSPAVNSRLASRLLGRATARTGHGEPGACRTVVSHSGRAQALRSWRLDPCRRNGRSRWCLDFRWPCLCRYVVADAYGRQ